jgi:hypothetical protein
MSVSQVELLMSNNVFDRIEPPVTVRTIAVLADSLFFWLHVDQAGWLCLQQEKLKAANTFLYVGGQQNSEWLFGSLSVLYNIAAWQGLGRRLDQLRVQRTKAEIQKLRL